MRDYVYIYNDKNESYLIVSGIEFEQLPKDNITILLKHKYCNARIDLATRFEFIIKTDIDDLLQEDLYSWGDFVWASSNGDSVPKLGYDDVARLLYFAHTGIMVGRFADTAINSAFFAHDDGWYLKCWYSDDSVIDRIVETIAQNNRLCGLDAASIKNSDNAYLIHNGDIRNIEKSQDIDMILNRYLRRT